MSNSSRTRWTVGIMLCAAALIFTALVCVVDVQPIGPLEGKVGFAGINGPVHEALPYHAGWYQVSKILGYLALVAAAAFAALGCVQLFRERSLKKVDPRFLALAGLYIAVAVLYVLFQKLALNHRPVLLGAEPEPSYPSTHTLLGCCLFISAGMVMGQEPASPLISRLLLLVPCLLAVMTVIARLLSGVHWLTDILGGLLISAALLTLFQAGLCTLRERRGNGTPV